MLSFNHMADKPKAKEQTQEMDAWFEKLEEKLKAVPHDLIEAGAKKVQDFIDGKIGWTDVFPFTPEQRFQMAEQGYNHFKLGRYQDAERFFKVLTILEWDNYYYHSMLGSILQRQKREGEAIIEYTSALECNPHDAVSLTNRGEIFMKHGWVDDAARDFEKAIAQDPQGENAWANRAHTLLDQIKKNKGPKK